MFLPSKTQGSWVPHFSGLLCTWLPIQKIPGKLVIAFGTFWCDWKPSLKQDFPAIRHEATQLDLVWVAVKLYTIANEPGREAITKDIAKHSFSWNIFDTVFGGDMIHWYDMHACTSCYDSQTVCDGNFTNFDEETRNWWIGGFLSLKLCNFSFLIAKVAMSLIYHICSSGSWLHCICRCYWDREHSKMYSW